MPNIFGWLGTQQQRELLTIVPKHMEITNKVVIALREAMAAFIEGDTEKVIEYDKIIFDHEREADELRRELLRRLSTGMFMPADRTDLAHLIEAMDAVADHANAASRLLVLFKDKPPQPLQEPLLNTCDVLIEAVNALTEAAELLYNGKGVEALEKCDQVEAAEEKADIQKQASLRILFGLELSARQLLLLHDLIQTLEETADRAEDSADVIRVLAVNIR